MSDVNCNQSHLVGQDCYLKQKSKQPLLSQEQVLGYARQVQQQNKLLQIKQELSRELKQEPTLAQWAVRANLSELALMASVRNGDRAKQKIIESNLSFVKAIARRYLKRGVEWQDLIQEGTIGLNRAIEKFDPTKGCKLNTYARWWIDRYILRAVALHQRNNLAMAGGESLPTPATTSLNRALSDSESTEMLELLESKAPQPEEAVAQLQRKNLINQWICGLSLRQQKTLKLIYGFKDGETRSLNQAAEELGLSLEQIRWSKKAALKKLKPQSQQAKALISNNL